MHVYKIMAVRSIGHFHDCVNHYE